MINSNIYKYFRTVGGATNLPGISKRFDEPTYLSFRLQFAANADNYLNTASNSVLYNRMPHPLFDLGSYEDSYGSGFITDTTFRQLEPESYSAYQYLVDANEPTRAQMLLEFVNSFNKMQSSYPYYFQSITGVGELLKVDTAKGQRILNDKKLNITCLEGLDLRMSHLMNLYRKIVWDDVYQRWVLPDMMRYFTLKIFISEFRTFHTPMPKSTSKDKQFELKSVPPELLQTQKSDPVYLNILDDILPTWVITCEMCEFDINNVSYEYLNTLDVGNAPAAGIVKFDVKVGNIKELQMYPTFRSMFLDDIKLNDYHRSRDENMTKKESKNSLEYPTSLKIAQARENLVSSRDAHLAGGYSYNERLNEDTTTDGGKVYPAKDPDTLSEATEPKFQNFPRPDKTWIGTAVDFGTAYAKNFINRTIDKGKITSVPGLGVSFTEVQAALQSKNVISALGLIRKGVDEVVRSYGNAPSSRLEQPIQTDSIMNQFFTSLAEIPKSTATSEQEAMLIDAANTVIADENLRNAIRDYSAASDLMNMTLAEVGPRTSVIETANLSSVEPNAVSKNLENTSDLRYGQPSERLGQSSDSESLKSGQASERLSQETDSEALRFGVASERLGAETPAGSLNRGVASERLGQVSNSESLKSGKPSERLSSEAPDQSLQRGIASENLGLEINTDNLSSIRPSQNLGSYLENRPMVSAKPSERLTTETPTESLRTVQSSERLGSDIFESKLESAQPSEKLGTKLIGNALTTKIDTRVKTIEAGKIIENIPTSKVKIESEPLKQPEPGKATTSNL